MPRRSLVRSLRRARSTRLWPWSHATALVLAPILLVALLGLVLVLRAAFRWPGDAYNGWSLLGVVLLSLLPVALLVLQHLVHSGGSLEVPGGLRIAFAATTAERELRSTTLSENLDPTGLPPVGGSSLRSIMRALRQAHDSDVTIVDLRRGQTWWETRLFILVAGAARRGRPRAIAFVGDHQGHKNAFLGWATPSRLVDMHLAAEPTLREAHQRAAAKARLFELQGAEPDLPKVTLPLIEGAEPDPAFAFELFLQSELDGAGFASLHRGVDVPRLHALYECDLVVEGIDEQATDEQWIELLARDRREFYAICTGKSLRTLVPREALVGAVLGRALADS